MKSVSASRLIEILSSLVLALAVIYLLLARPVWFSTSLVADQQKLLSSFAQGEVHGIDVSHDQGKVDWQQVAGSQVAFVYHKVSDGITWQDPMFASNIVEINKVKLPVGPYHFFEAEDDALKQAENFLSSIQGKSLTLRPMVDVEITRTQTSAQIHSRLRQFLAKIKQATGCDAIIYSYKDFWQANIGPAFNDYDFWLADYSSTMTAPAEVRNLIIWQYSDKGKIPGIKGDVDLDKLLDDAGLATLACDYKAEQ